MGFGKVLSAFGRVSHPAAPVYIRIPRCGVSGVF